MPIKVTAPDGSVVTFPDGTSEATIRSAMAKEFGGPKQPAPRPQAPAAPKERGFFDKAGDAVGTVLRGVQRGILMNADDEIQAGLATVVPGWGGSAWEQSGSVGERFSKAYNAAINPYRAKTREDQEKRPVLAALSEATGAVAPMLVTKTPRAPVPRAAPRPAPVPASPVRRVANAAAVGGGQGAVSGFNAGEGTLDNRLDSASMGVVTGATIGTGFGFLGEAAPIAKRYYDVLRGKGSREEAMRQLTARLKNDGFDISDPAGQQKLAAALDEYDQVGKPAALADVGDSTRRRTGVALRTDNPNRGSGRATVEGRLADGEGRLKEDVFATVAPKDDVYAEAETLIRQREAEAGANYAASNSARDLTWTDKLGELIKRPSMREGLAYAAKLAADEGRDPMTLGFIADSKGNITKVEAPSMETWDYIKRALDYKISQNTVEVPFKGAKLNETGRVVTNLKNDLLAELDILNPAYGKARNEFRGKSELLNALDQGRGYNSMDPEQITVTRGRLSEPAQDMFRIGAARDLTDRLGNTTEGANPALRILRNTNEKQRLAATGANVDELGRRVGMERNLGLLNQELRGSPTDERMGERLASMGEIPTGGVGMGRMALNWLMEKPSLQRNEAVNAELIPMALEMEPGARGQLIDELIKEGKRGQEVAEKIMRAVTAATTVSSRMTAGATAIREPILLEE